MTLYNLTPQGRLDFRLPAVSMPITFYLKNGEEVEQLAVSDTLIIEPDRGRFMIVFRVAHPLKRNMFEVAQVVAGRMPRGWYRAREVGKTYYSSIQAYVAQGALERRKEPGRRR